MFHSVRGRLLLNSVLVSIATILIVGLVAMLLVNAYFKQQEEAYLRSQAQQFAPTFTQAMLSNNLLEVQRVAAFTSFANQTRVKVYDRAGQLLADSGPRTGDNLINPLVTPAPDVIFGVVVDENGRITRFSPPLGRQIDPAGGINLSLIEPEQLFTMDEPFTAVSNTSYYLPLTFAGQTIGALELSEGPAVGEGVMRYIWLALLGGSFVALAIAITAGLLSARQVTRPLQALGKAADAMGRGDMDARAPASNLQEYDQLAAQFNAMAKRLTGTIERLEAERTILRHTLTDASHELRTPLTALKTFNTLLEDEVSAAEPARQFVQESARQIDQLDRLTQDMLDLSRLEARLRGTNFVMADLREPITAAVDALKPLWRAKDQQVDVRIPPEELRYAHDPVAMQQATANLLHNAIKYTPNGGQILVSLRDTETAVEICVQDSGLGITLEDQERIFDRFYRGSDQLDGGAGLGLAIVREIVEIHNGRINVTSTPGAGSAFTISLPQKT